MRLVAGYPIFVTDKLAECRAFYQRLGFEVIFEAKWFLYLSGAGDAPFSLAFMTPDHPSTPPRPGVFADGAFITLQVENAATAYETLRSQGLEMAYELHDEPWGQRRFALTDPAGIWVDVVEQTEAAPGFWDPYL
ncbi:MAG TPA: VOC family protein [Thermoanaerobaculia bacterium]|nr:VOC family protein [Thermoanaerobaculia bacterium]